MKFICRNKKDGTIILKGKYPRIKISEPIEGAIDIQYYVIVEEKPLFNQDIEYISEDGYNFTNEKYEGYDHLLIAKTQYKINTYAKGIIINRLNDELGTYLDSLYPFWERDKHTRELLFQKKTSKKKYISDLDSWIDECRSINELRKKDYIENKKIPEFGNFPIKPEKL